MGRQRIKFGPYSAPVDFDPYQELANAIVSQAIIDLFNPSGRYVVMCRKFLKSDWYQLITDLDPDVLFNKYEEVYKVKIWHYRGPVYRFEKVAQDMYDQYTSAPTMGKALSNLAARWKKENKLEMSARVELDSAFIKEEELT